MSRKYSKGFCIILLLGILATSFLGNVYAAEPTGEYLQYQEAKPAGSSSALSTLSYIFSLIITFALVIGLAYFASRFLGKRMGISSAMGNQKIISTLSLGANRGIYVVEIAGKFLVLGVTEQNITVLQEITDSMEIEKIKAEQLSIPDIPFEKVFQRQLASLQKLSPKFPNVFNLQQKDEEKQEGEKR